MQSPPVQQVNGWLISPDGHFCYRFHRDSKSWIRNPFVFVDQWSAQVDGTPSQMKQRLRLPLDEALELCGQMLLDGWQKLTTQFGEDPDPQLTEEIAA